MLNGVEEPTAPYALYAKVYLVVQQVPAGQVATYGDVAQIVGGGCTARIVGQALNEIPKRAAQVTPWQRIVNSAGGISTRGLRQRELLAAEGVTFDARATIDLRRYRWRGPSPEWAAANACQPLPPLAPTSEDEAGPQQLRLF